MVVRGETRDGQSTASFAAKSFQEYKQVQPIREQPTNRVLSRWIWPPTGVVKMNFGGSLNGVERRGGIGVLLQRPMKEVITGAHQAFLEGVMEPAMIEIYAGIRALSFGQQMDFSKIILECDALTVINQINQAGHSLCFWEPD